MKPLLRFVPFALLLASVAHAHPGHDGHELVWEYRGGHVHLDWVLWTLIAGLAVFGAYRYVTARR